MAGTANDDIRTETGAGGGQRAIGLTQVQADAKAGSQLQIIVDDQRGAVALA